MRPALAALLLLLVATPARAALPGPVLGPIGPVAAGYGELASGEAACFEYDSNGQSIVAQTCVSGFDTRLLVYDGDEVELQAIEDDDAGVCDEAARASWSWAAPTEGDLFLCVAGEGVEAGVFHLDLAIEDADGDGVGLPVDCDDDDDDVYPDAPEICDGQDSDCDTWIGDEETDLDGDGLFPCNGDCDDFDADVYTGADELCDGKDSNCDHEFEVDEYDADDDGFPGCNDCDDLEPASFPGNDELCDGIDNDCSGSPGADEVDADGDFELACAGDCDDGEALSATYLPEICGDGLDNDCDDDADEDCDEGGCSVAGAHQGGGVAAITLLLIAGWSRRRRLR
jgi:hypothetical protein